MDKVFNVQLFPDPDEVETYENNEENIVQVRVQLPSGEMVTTHDYKVELTMSSEAMIGLATNLIRSAVLGPSSAHVWHLRRSEVGFAGQTLGVYLHPESCELIVVQTNLGTLSEALGET